MFVQTQISSAHLHFNQLLIFKKNEVIQIANWAIGSIAASVQIFNVLMQAKIQQVKFKCKHIFINCINTKLKCKPTNPFCISKAFSKYLVAIIKLLTLLVVLMQNLLVSLLKLLVSIQIDLVLIQKLNLTYARFQKRLIIIDLHCHSPPFNYVE